MIRVFLLAVTCASVYARCPYSQLWIKYGPERAAQILAQRNSKPRKLQEVDTQSSDLPDIGYGVCVYQNPFAGTTDCVQFSGSGFTDATAKSACDSAMGGMAKGVLTKNTRCYASTNPMLAGHCYTNQGPTTQAMPMLMNSQMPTMSTCEQVASSCTTWSRGTFVMGSSCSGPTKKIMNAGAPTANSAPTAAPGPVDKCIIAPGPMGAAHMHAQSTGYKVDCKDAPARNSPYQLPPKWTAETYSVALPFDKSKAGYTSTGQVWYDFGRNFKRLDTFEQTGVQNAQFTAGSPPKEDVKKSTMLHRRDRMWFIDYYKNNTATCTYLKMMVGNVRPDWFMDNRGAATSVQFLGNQHIFHKDKPTLVKQWRKKDFADMYFTMSVLANKGKDGVHWPVQMNTPGEGFGDDALYNYWNHKQLTDKDDDVFFVDKDLNCVPHQSAGGAPDMEHTIPSNLNVDEAGWVELEYTASPQGPSLERALYTAMGQETSPQKQEAPAGIAQLDGNGELHACEEKSGKLSITAKFTSESVWTAVGIRPSSRCRMVPARVNVAHKNGDSWSVHAGELTNDMRGGNLASFMSTSKPASGVEVNREGQTTSISFSEPLPSDGKIHFSYAIGNSPQMSYHGARGCVTLENIPKCSAMPLIAQQKEASVARREAPDSGCESVDKLSEHITKLSTKLDDMTKPNCGQFQRVQQCNRWNIFCRWSLKTKKCANR